MSMRRYSARKSHFLRILQIMVRNTNSCLLSSGTQSHALSIFTTAGAFLNTVHPTTPLSAAAAAASSAATSLIHRTTTSPPIATTAFHPHKMILACSALGSGAVELKTCLKDGEKGQVT